MRFWWGENDDGTVERTGKPRDHDAAPAQSGLAGIGRDDVLCRDAVCSAVGFAGDDDHNVGREMLEQAGVSPWVDGGDAAGNIIKADAVGSEVDGAVENYMLALS